MKERTKAYTLARLRHHVVPLLGRKRETLPCRLPCLRDPPFVKMFIAAEERDRRTARGRSAAVVGNIVPNYSIARPEITWRHAPPHGFDRYLWARRASLAATPVTTDQSGRRIPSRSQRPQHHQHSRSARRREPESAGTARCRKSRTRNSRPTSVSEARHMPCSHRSTDRRPSASSRSRDDRSSDIGSWIPERERCQT